MSCTSSQPLKPPASRETYDPEIVGWPLDDEDLLALQEHELVVHRDVVPHGNVQIAVLAGARVGARVAADRRPPVQRPRPPDRACEPKSRNRAESWARASEEVGNVGGRSGV